MIFSYDTIVSVALRFIYVFLFCRTLANDARENGNDSDTSIDRKQSSNKKPTSMASEKIVEKNKVSSEEDMKKEVKSSIKELWSNKSASGFVIEVAAAPSQEHKDLFASEVIKASLEKKEEQVQLAADCLQQMFIDNHLQLTTLQTE